MAKMIVFLIFLAFFASVQAAVPSGYTVVCYGDQQYGQDFLARNEKVRKREKKGKDEALSPEGSLEVLAGGVLVSFSNLVKDYIKNGWRPQGGVSAFSYVTGGGRYIGKTVQTEYCQALVKISSEGE